jgi:hypothetical protein
MLTYWDRRVLPATMLDTRWLHATLGTRWLHATLDTRQLPAARHRTRRIDARRREYMLECVDWYEEVVGLHCYL